MMRTQVPLSLLVFSLLVFQLPPVAHASGGAEWLLRLSQALAATSFHGDLVYSEGDQWQSLMISQSLVDGQPRRQTEFLTGEPRQQLRQGSTLLCLHNGPHRAGLMPDVFKGFEQLTESRLDLILDSYRLVVVDSPQRIAGRSAVQVNLMPDTSDRFAYHLWLDQDTGLLLGSDLLDTSGRLLQRFRFARLEIGADTPISPSETELHGHRIAVVGADDVVTYPESGWWPSFVPSGYEPVRYARSADSSDVWHERVLFSDGLASFTLFVDEVPDAGLPDLSQRWNATAAVVRRVTDGDRHYRITLVGELPPAVVADIAASVRPDDHIAHR